MRAYRVKVTVRNNLLLSAIEAAGYKTQADFARACDIHPHTLNGLVAMREAPINSEGNFTVTANLIMEALGACPTDLWTEEQLVMKLARNTIEKELSTEAIMEAIQYECGSLLELLSPEDILEQKQKRQAVEDVLDTLTPRESKFLRMKYGLGEIDEPEKYNAEISKVFDKSRQWSVMTEKRAFTKLRYGSRGHALKQLIENK